MNSRCIWSEFKWYELKAILSGDLVLSVSHRDEVQRVRDVTSLLMVGTSWCRFMFGMFRIWWGWWYTTSSTPWIFSLMMVARRWSCGRLKNFQALHDLFILV